jgi:hypothetical protein
MTSPRLDRNVEPINLREEVAKAIAQSPETKKIVDAIERDFYEIMSATDSNRNAS